MPYMHSLLYLSSTLLLHHCLAGHQQEGAPYESHLARGVFLLEFFLAPEVC